MTRVAVVGGGANSEHEVSLRSAAAVGDALERADHEVVRITIGTDAVWRDADGPLGRTPAGSIAAALAMLDGVDAVFPALHGRLGEDGSMAGLLGLADIPVVGCGVQAGALGLDKQATKLAAASLGIAVADGVVVQPGDALPPVRLPAVVKPTSAGSSMGVALVRSPEELAVAVAVARRHSAAVLVEQVVVGREVHVGVLEHPDGTRTATPPVEFRVAHGTVFDTSRKYDGSTTVLLPAPVTADQLAAMHTASLRLFDALGCAGLSRFDFFVTEDDIVLNEVNTMPGLTEQSGYPRMTEAVGYPLPALAAELVATAIAQHRARPAAFAPVVG
jgi:D-alanine-D-alanine ligase